MQWLNEPASWQRTGDVLRVSVDPGTDFWRTTGYGYVHDNGHVYGDLLPGDLDVSVRVRGAFGNQYDQAGIMLRADEQTWLKTGLEFFEGRPRLSTVLTVGWSSWIVADLPPGIDEVTLRVSRRGDAVEVRYAAGDGAAELAALVYLPPDREMLAGIVCAAPEGTGFSVAFHDLRIAGRDWGGQGALDGADWAGEAAAPASGWAPDAAAGTGAGWTGTAAGWESDQADDAAGWAGDRPDEAPSSWAGGKPDEAASGWAEDKLAEAASGWAEDKLAEAASRWAGGKPDEALSGWAEDKLAEAASRWAGGKPDDKPDGAAASWAKKTPSGAATSWRGERPENVSLDWAKPQANEPAADWDRLSLSVTGGWSVIPAGEPGKAQPLEPADEQPKELVTDQAEHASQDSEASQDGKTDQDSKTDQSRNGDQSSKASQGSETDQDSTGEPPEPPAGDKTDPVLAAAGSSAVPAQPGGTNGRGRNGRGRSKAKLPAPRSADLPVLADPAAQADEWISLLTADQADD